MERNVADDLRESLGDKGFIRFGIKAQNTESNSQVHEAFKEFCKTEANNDYTLGLKYLLQAYQEDYKYSTLRDLIMSLKMEIDELRTKVETEKVDNTTQEAF